MRPEATQDTGSGTEESFDSWKALQRSTDGTRADIIADIVGHPEESPSVAELDYMNPSLDTDTIRNHLKVLIEADVVEELTVPAGERTRGYPYKFYRLTDAARDLFDKNGLFPRDAWQRQYERVEKTAEIRERERMPRPSAD